MAPASRDAAVCMTRTLNNRVVRIKNLGAKQIVKKCVFTPKLIFIFAVAYFNSVHCYIPSTEIAWITVVGKEGMIYRSSDGGNSWRPQDSGVMSDLLDVFFTSARDGAIVGANATILQTSDGGRSWSSTPCGISSVQNATFMGLSVFAVSAGTSYFIVGQEGLLLLSTDGQGATWTAMQIPPGCFASNSIGCSANTTWVTGTGVPDLLRVRFFDNLNGIIVGQSQNILITDDGGISFSVLQPVDLSSTPGAYYSALDFDQVSNQP